METEGVLIDCKKKLRILRCDNNWLMFFRIPKLLLISQKLERELNCSTDWSLWHEIGFLFNNSCDAAKDMNAKVKVNCVIVCYGRLQCTNSS